jgi:nucleoside-diphosphate-sugar epimerase
MTDKIAAFINDDLVRIYPSVANKLSESYGKCFLITGGAGFLGSWICEWLMFLNRNENAGIKIYILDRESDNFEQRFSQEINNKEIVIINSDIRSLTEIPRDVNYIIHAAATPDTRYHVSCPMDTMTTIAEGTAAMLRAASRLSNLIGILNISSSAFYANAGSASLKENGEALNFSPNLSTVYAEAKRYAEKLCQAARNELRIPIVNVRPFTFCGPYQDLSSPWILNTFINDALNNRQIRIYGDGQTVRGVMYGADFAVWILIILMHAKSAATFNVGSDIPVLASDLANRVASNFSPQPSIMLNTSLAKINDRTHLLPDLNVVKDEFNIGLFTNLDLSVSRTVSWFKQIYK